jgi:hypothetical protein
MNCEKNSDQTVDAPQRNSANATLIGASGSERVYDPSCFSKVIESRFSCGWAFIKCTWNAIIINPIWMKIYEANYGYSNKIKI